MAGQIQQTNADSIRTFVLQRFIEPARARGEKTVVIAALEIHDRMGLEKRFPLVCSAIDADKFLEYAHVTLVERSGPHQSTTVRWKFAL